MFGYNISPDRRDKSYYTKSLTCLQHNHAQAVNRGGRNLPPDLSAGSLGGVLEDLAMVSEDPGVCFHVISVILPQDPVHSRKIQ